MHAEGATRLLPTRLLHAEGATRLLPVSRDAEGAARLSPGGAEGATRLLPTMNLDAEGATSLLPVTQNRSRSPIRSEAGPLCGPDARVVEGSARSPPRPARLSSGDPGGLLRVGFWFTHQEHLEKARNLSHPMDSANPIAPQTLEVLRKYMTSSPSELSMARRLALLKVRLLVRTLDKDEAQLHKQFPPWYEKVVASKKILAWKRLLEENNYDDLEVANFLLKGCPLVGTSDLPGAFDPKIVPAKMTESELRATSIARRTAMVHSHRTIETEHASHLEKATAEEVERGFLDGPYTEEQVSEKLGTKHWCAVRRFVLVQGAELKLRPIDDCAEAQLNDAYTSTIKLRMMDSDYVSALALRIARAEADRAADLGVEPRAWVGKTLDLTKAYKQLPIEPKHRDLCV